MSMKYFSSFQALPQKDRQRLVALGLVLLALMLCTWNLAPALKALREVPLQLTQLQDQTQKLKLMQAQAQAFQKSPRLPTREAGLLLQKAAAETLASGATQHRRHARHFDAQQCFSRIIGAVFSRGPNAGPSFAH